MITLLRQLETVNTSMHLPIFRFAAVSVTAVSPPKIGVAEFELK